MRASMMRACAWMVVSQLSSIPRLRKGTCYTQGVKGEGEGTGRMFHPFRSVSRGYAYRYAWSAVGEREGYRHRAKALGTRLRVQGS
eukprot:3031899-Prymnesium_polylepis.1